MPTKTKRAVILAAHTDDAEFGAGGVMVNLIRAGYKVVMGNMVAGGAETTGRKSAALTGAAVEWLGFEAQAIQDTPAAFAVVESFLDRHQPDLILTHWPVDEHPDHRVTGSLAIRYVNARQQLRIDKDGRAQPEHHCPQLLFFEVISGKQSKCFRPDRFVDLDQDAFDLKKRLMRLYTGKPMTGYMKSVYAHHLLMLEFRARESGACRHSEIDRGIWAEAFVSYPLPRGQTRIALPGER